MRRLTNSKGTLCLALTVGLTAMTASLAGCAASQRGVALAEFTAADGRYFPPFILRFFPGAQFFVRNFPSLMEASSEIRLIEVKRLTSDAAGTFNEANLSWSADGVYLSYEFLAGMQRKIQVKDLVGDYSRDLVMVPTGKNDFLDGLVFRAIHSYNAGLSWSRDSTRFAFMSNGGVGEYNIYIGAVGAAEKPVANSPSKDGYATWNPSGNELAFVSARSGNGDIYTIDLDNGKLARLTSSQQVDIFPNWFPQGGGLVYSGGDAANHDIFVAERPRAGAWKSPYKLTNWLEDDMRPTVSPDGNYIAFYATSPRQKDSDHKAWNIHVLPFKPGKTYEASELSETVIAEDVVVDLNTGPAWTPDSRRIFYVKHEPKVFNPIYGYDLFTGRSYTLDTKTRMNRDILMSRLGILSFRAQVGAWDRVFLALTNQGEQLQGFKYRPSKIHYLKL